MRLDRADAQRRTCSTRGSRRRSGRSRRSAGPSDTDDLRAFYPGDLQHDRPRDHPALGEPDDLHRARADGRRPVRGRDHPLDRARPRRAAGCRRASAPASTRSTLIDAHGADATRYGLLKMSSTQDVRFSDGAIEEGRKLANKLWNVARLILANAGRRAAAERPADARGALDPRPARRRRSARSSARLGEFDFVARRRRALPPHLRRLLRLVRGGDQAAALRRRRGRARDRARRARAAAQAAPPGDAARDRGDLDEPARRARRG